MMLTNAVALTMLASGAPADVGYLPLVEGRNAEAVEELQSNDQLKTDDPARLINLGVALARQGQEAEARKMFEAAMRQADRLVLETADGQWKDSRHLARLALKMLDSGELGGARMAAR